jgi:beta-lactamase regulating signal transducer with metallopeptidase domain
MQAVTDYQSLLLKASWQAAALIVLVLTVRWAFGRRLSPRWRHGLWLLVVLRLALPWTIPSIFSLFNLLNFSKAAVAIAGMRTTSSVADSQTPPTAGSDLADGTPPQVAIAPTVVAPGFHVNPAWLTLGWAAGAFTLALYLMSTHYRLSRRIAQCRPLIDSQVMNLLEDCKQVMGVHVPVALVETKAVDGPCLFGFLRPRLLLPPGFTRSFSLDELRHVFLHELGHVKRHDIPLGWLMAWLQILHWFNPLVWLAFSRMRVDRELACDALALSHVEEADYKPYGRTMVKLLEGFGDSLRVPSLAGIIEDKQQMKERISMIAKHKKTHRGTALAGFLIMGLGLLTLTDAQTTNKSSPATIGAGTAAPKIVATSPSIGAKDVDPALTEITVTFDQDMGRGMSWTGGGPDFPKSPEGKRAKWRDKRTCVLPVELESGHYYRVGINSTSYRNFRSASGVAAQPSVISFTTQGASEALKARTIVPQVVRIEPSNKAQNVSPTLTELRVTFDVPMGGGCSWCTVSDDGADFPKAPEGKNVYWTKDKKTCVLPVELKPGMTYRLSLNDANYKNFQSAAGVPLEPVICTFKTSDKP